MEIEIWSDIACPFCYIGKHHLEQALEQFEHSDEVEITWHSFELDPGAETDPGRDIYEMLADKYGRTVEWARQANKEMQQKAEAAGVTLNPDTIQPTNTFDAHRLIKLAERNGLAHEAEEALFAAYFSEGRHIARPDTLAAIGEEIGLEAEEVSAMLEGDRYGDEVRADEREAQQLQIRGVPFFVFNRQYAISGAQPVDAFLQTLQRCHEEQENAGETDS